MKKVILFLTLVMGLLFVQTTSASPEPPNWWFEYKGIVMQTSPVEVAVPGQSDGIGIAILNKYDGPLYDFYFILDFKSVEEIDGFGAYLRDSETEKVHTDCTLDRFSSEEPSLDCSFSIPAYSTARFELIMMFEGDQATEVVVEGRMGSHDFTGGKPPWEIIERSLVMTPVKKQLVFIPIARSP